MREQRYRIILILPNVGEVNAESLAEIYALYLLYEVSIRLVGWGSAKNLVILLE